jgi:hypothetical protein
MAAKNRKRDRDETCGTSETCDPRVAAALNARYADHFNVDSTRPSPNSAGKVFFGVY